MAKKISMPNLSALKEFLLAMEFALQAAEYHQKNLDKTQRLEELAEAQKAKIHELEILLKGYETLTEKRVQICPECNGNGAYTIRGEVEECDNCDTAGWIEITKTTSYAH